MIKINIALSKVISFLNTKNYSLYNNKKLKITGFKSLESAEKGDITFCSLSNKKGLKLISLSSASVIICHESLKNKIKNSKINLIFVENPRLSFIRCIKEFFPEEKFFGVHKTAIVESKNLGKGVYIGPYTYIGKNVIIGKNCRIYGHVNIYGNVKIGNNVIIDSFTAIGGDGFGFERNQKMQLEKFPHLGGIEIKDDVEIGANVCIDKGTINNTVIEKGTKIDNLVHVAHNVKIGKNCLIVANVVLGGSSVIGDNTHIAMSATIRDGSIIGSNVLVGMGSVVTKNVPKNITVIGIPAKPITKN